MPAAYGGDLSPIPDASWVADDPTPEAIGLDKHHQGAHYRRLSAQVFSFAESRWFLRQAK
jgi:hypothetical protein